MHTIRVVGGTGEGPTAMAAYDTALANAGVHNYNLIHVSSVIPIGSAVEYCDEAPDLGPVGGKLTVVEARATVKTESSGAADTGMSACAGLGWAVDEHGRGLFYEASGQDSESVCETIERGLGAGRDLREWSFVDERIVTESTTEGLTDDGFATAVVLGIYGESEPIL